MKYSPSVLFAVPLLVSALFGSGCAKPPAEAPAPPQPSATTSTPATATSTAPKPTTTAPKPRTAPRTTAPAPTNAHVTVTISGMQFLPQSLAIHAGDSVTWINKDTVPHTTISDNSILWDSGTLRPGASFTHVFKAPGGYSYHCGVHPSMTGNVIVR